MSSTFSKQSDELQKSQERLKKFRDLLDRIESADDNVKSLWAEIYDNATADRERASMLYTDLFMDVKGSAEKHGLYGTQMAKYLERMCKSNDQLLRLAEMIERVERQVGEVDVNDIFDKIKEDE
jgi:CII-binding regulator of phage lambda lysogenization HflD